MVLGEWGCVVPTSFIYPTVGALWLADVVQTALAGATVDLFQSGSVTLGPATIAATNIRITKANITGTLVVIADGVSKFLGGPHFLAEARKDRLIALGQVQVNLAQINARLHAAAAGSGVRLDHGYKPGPDTLTLHITRRPSPPGPVVR